MKLINHLILRLTLFFTVVLLLWSVLYYFLQMHEIYDSIDEGLTNLKQEFVIIANRDSGFVENMELYAPLNLIVKEIPQSEAITVKEYFSNSKVYFQTELEEEEVRMLTSAFYCTLNGKYYQIQFFTSTVESEDLRENMFLMLLGLWIVLVLTLTIVGKIVISKANKPLFHLLDEMQKFRLDNSKMPDFSETKIIEFAKLNETVKELLTQNINIFNEQKQFIENTTHELQTPLAIVIAKLEMALEKYQNEKELANEIVSMLKTLNRMKRLDNNLLLLSKIQNNQFPVTSVVNLRDVLETTLTDFEDIIAHKQLTVESTGDAVPMLNINTDLAFILFTNLVKNAVAHNTPAGKIIVSYNENAITISNSGNKPLTDVFIRYKSDNSSGLGLSIVKSITDLYKKTIEYRFENNLHVFEIKLK